MTETFEMFAIVELFGHTTIAGRISEQTIAGKGFLRIDVPEITIRGITAPISGFVKFIGPDAIYSITPVDEETMMGVARTLRVRQVNTYVDLTLNPMLQEKIIDEDFDDDDDIRED